MEEMRSITTTMLKPLVMVMTKKTVDVDINVNGDHQRLPVWTFITNVDRLIVVLKTTTTTTTKTKTITTVFVAVVTITAACTRAYPVYLVYRLRTCYDYIPSKSRAFMTVIVES